MADVTADAITIVNTVLTAGSLGATIYNRHNVANLSLDAITIGVESQAPVDGGTGSDLIINHEIVMSVRIHTAYSNQAFDDAGTVALMDAVVSQMQENRSLNAIYRSMSFSVSSYRAEFAESASRGGQVDLTIHAVQNYTQE